MAVLDNNDYNDEEEMELLVTGSGDKTVRLWNISNFKDTKMRRLVCTFTGHSKKVC